MSTQPAPLPPLASYKEACNLLTKHPVDVKKVKDLIAQYPGLAREDSEWKENISPRPLIFAAIDSGSTETVDALLKAGASPLHKDVHTGNNTINYILQRDYQPSMMPILSLLLAHHDFPVEHDFKSLPQRPPAEFLGFCLPIVEPEDYSTPPTYAGRDELMRNIVTLIQRTPDHLIFNPYGASSILGGSLTSGTQAHDADLLFLAGALVNRGIDPSTMAEDGHPVLVLLGEALKRPYLVSILLAMGMDERGTMHDYESEPTTIEEAINAYNRENVTFIRQQADDILKAELKRCTIERAISPEELLITPEGRATWQAQGLARRHMLEKLFTPDNALLFGSAQQQACLAARLTHILPPSFEGEFTLAPALMRDARLAAPENTASVKHLRGGVSLEKGGGTAQGGIA